MTARKTSTAEAAEPRRRTKGPVKFTNRHMPKVRQLLSHGLDDHALAACFGVDLEQWLIWASENDNLRSALDNREELHKWDADRNIEMARQLAARGATQIEIAAAFRVTERTLTRWRQDYPEFDDALQMGEEMQLEVAKRTLFKMATGFTYTEEKTVAVKGALMKVREEKVHLPSENSLRLFLISREPQTYSGKATGEKPSALAELAQELIDITSNAGAASGVVPVEKDAG